MHRNEDMFRAATGGLREGGAIQIFPEGRSHSEAHLVEFRTGAARIAAAGRGGGGMGVGTLDRAGRDHVLAQGARADGGGRAFRARLRVRRPEGRLARGPGRGRENAHREDRGGNPRPHPQLRPSRGPGAGGGGGAALRARVPLGPVAGSGGAGRPFSPPAALRRRVGVDPARGPRGAPRAQAQGGTLRRSECAPRGRGGGRAAPLRPGAGRTLHRRAGDPAPAGAAVRLGGVGVSGCL